MNRKQQHEPCRRQQQQQQQQQNSSTGMYCCTTSTAKLFVRLRPLMSRRPAVDRLGLPISALMSRRMGLTIPPAASLAPNVAVGIVGWVGQA